MAGAGSEIAAHYAALQVSLVKAGLLDASEGLAEWWAEYELGEDDVFEDLAEQELEED